MEALLVSGLTSVSKGLLAHMIYDSYDLIKETATHSDPHLQGVMNDLDLTADFQVIEALLGQISDEADVPHPISICLKNVSDMVRDIKLELETIQAEIKEHENRWFSNWRTPSYQNSICRLVKHKKILDKRVDLLIKIIQIEQNT